MSDVFISYSRKNKDFMSRLHEALTQAEREVWVDWEDIPSGVDFLSEIYDGIEKAHTFVFIVSQHSLTSEICNYEVRHATEHNKRIVPIILEEIKGEVRNRVAGGWLDQEWETVARENWKHLQALNWLFFRAEDDFDNAFADLLETLDEDQDHVKAHTNIGLRARKWANEARDPSFLLVGRELEDAEGWRRHATAENKKPVPTTLQQEYIAESRRVADERMEEEARRERLTKIFRRVTTIMTVVGVLLLAMLIYGVDRIEQAQSRADDANTQVADAGETLTPIPGILTPIPPTLTGAANQVMEAGQTLTPIPATLTAVAEQIQEGVDYIESLRLAAEANAILQEPDGNVETAALLGILALNTAYSPQADGALVQAVDRLITEQVFSVHDDRVSSAVFSLDGRFLLTASDNRAIIWDAATREKIATFEHTGGLSGGTFSPDGQRIATIGSGRVIVWDVESGDQLHTLRGFDGPATTIAFSPDGQLIATTGWDDLPRIWNPTTGEEWILSGNHPTHVTNAVFSPDGQYVVTTSWGSSIKIHDTTTGEQLRTLSDYAGEVVSVGFSRDSYLIIAADMDGEVIIWNAASGERLRSFSAHSDPVYAVAFSPDGQRILTASYDNTAAIWDARTGDRLHTLIGHTGWVVDASFSPDGQRIITASHDGSVRLWRDAAPIIESEAPLQVVSLGSMGQSILVTTGWNEVTLRDMDPWSPAFGDPLHILKHPDWVRVLAVASSGKMILTGSDDGKARLWDMDLESPNYGTILHALEHPDAVHHVAFSPDGETILTACEDNNVRLWDMIPESPDYGTVILTLDHLDGVNSIAFSANGRAVLTGSSDHLARVWVLDLRSPDYGTISETYQHPDPISNARFSPDGHYILTQSRWFNTILWNRNTGEEDRTFTVGNETETGGRRPTILFSPDGQYILTYHQSDPIRLWEVATGTIVQTLDHPDGIISAVFSLDGRTLLTGGYDRKARLWDVTTGTELRVLSGHSGIVVRVAFGPDGQTVLTGDEYSFRSRAAVRSWILSWWDFVDYACTRVFRDLTDGERAQYGIEDDVPTCPQFEG